MTQESSLICQTCGKPVDKSGSMTQWLFTSNKCSCTADDKPEQRVLRICPICGLRLRGNEGTMTGWLFRSKSCECLNDKIVEKQVTTTNLPAQDLVDDDPFEWLGVAGEGGLGTVYKARDRKLGRIIAVKVMQQDLEDPRAAETFMREAKSASKLQHPNVITISDFGLMKDGRYFLSLEWIDGITLAEHLERHGPLPVEAAVEIFTQILDGLSHAHNRDVVHRDIKPNNIMLGRTDLGGWMVKLIDFGTAKEIRHDGFLTRAEDMMCSPYYVSPERVNGLFVDNRADLYSLGCTLFEALTGQPPFVGEALPVVMKHLNEMPPSLYEASNGKRQFPDYLEQIVAKLLAKNPEDRFLSAAETKKALEEETVKEAVSQLAAQQANTGVRKIDSRITKSQWIVATCLILTALIGMSLVLVLVPHEDNDAKQESASEETPYPSTFGANLNKNATGLSGFGTRHVRLGEPTKRDFEQLKSSVHAEQITIGNCAGVPRNAFADLACGNTLQRVDFDVCTNPNPRALAPLKDYPKFFQMTLTETTLEPEFLRAAGELPNLTGLELKYCTFPTKAIAELSSASGLRFLKMPGANLTDKDLSLLAHPNLEILDLSHNDISGECFKNLKCKEHIRMLVLHALMARQFDFSGLKDYPVLDSIEFGGTPISANILHDLAQIPNLVSLNLTGCKIDSDAYKTLGRLAGVTNLSLAETQISDKYLADLRGMRNIRRIDFRATKVTKEGLETLKKTWKNKEVILVPPWHTKD